MGSRSRSKSKVRKMIAEMESGELPEHLPKVTKELVVDVRGPRPGGQPSGTDSDMTPVIHLVQDGSEEGQWVEVNGEMMFLNVTRITVSPDQQ